MTLDLESGLWSWLIQRCSAQWEVTSRCTVHPHKRHGWTIEIDQMNCSRKEFVILTMQMSMLHGIPLKMFICQFLYYIDIVRRWLPSFWWKSLLCSGRTWGGWDPPIDADIGRVCFRRNYSMGRHLSILGSWSQVKIDRIHRRASILGQGLLWCRLCSVIILTSRSMFIGWPRTGWRERSLSLPGNTEGSPRLTLP